MHHSPIRISLMLVVLWTSLALSQTINPLPNPASATFPTALNDYLLKEPADRYSRQFKGFVKSGWTAPTSGTLTHTVSAFEAFPHGYAVSQNATAVTYTASRRTFLFIDSVTTRSPEVVASGGTGCTFKSRQSHLVAIECSTASAHPTLSVPDLVLMLSVDTSGSAITAVHRLAFPDPVSATRYEVNPVMLGATPDDDTDDYAAFAEAVEILKGRGGGKIVVPNGEFRLSQALVLDGNNVAIEGVSSAVGGMFYTGAQLRSTNPAATVLQLKNSQNGSIKNLMLGYTVNANAGVSALRLTNSAQFRVQDVSVFDTHAYHGVTLEQDGTSDNITIYGWVSNLFVANCQADGLRIVGAGPGFDSFVGDTKYHGVFLHNNISAGVRVMDNVQGQYFGDINLFGNGVNLLIEPSVLDDRTVNLFVGPGAVIDTAQILNISAINTNRVVISGSWISFCTSVGCTGGGIYMPTPNVTGWRIVDNHILLNNLRGVLFNGKESLIAGNVFWKNPANGSGEGINLGSDSSAVTVVGNNFIGHTTSIANTGTNNSIGGNGLSEFAGSIVNHSPAVFAGDSNFWMGKVTGNPVINFDPNDFAQYDRITNQYNWYVNNTSVGSFSLNGFLPRSVSFSALPASPDGFVVWCSNCLVASFPCTSGGTGAHAFRQNGAWRCN